MDNKKIAEKLLVVEMDDLQDAEMLAEYAHEINAMGDAAIAGSLAQRAKMRLQHMAECKRTVETVIARLEAEGMEAPGSVYKDLLDSHIEKQIARVHSLIETI